MAHVLRTRFTHLAIAGVLLSAQALASAHSAGREDYSLAQQVAGVEALNGIVQKLDQLEQRLLPAYGASIPVIRMEEIKRGDPADAAAEAAIQTPVERLHEQGATVIRRIASLEPMWSACGLSHESIEVLSVLSHRTEELLVQRRAAKTREIAEWSRTGSAEGLQRLKSAHELNCRPVRGALTGTLPALQDAYAPLAQALASHPEGAAAATAKTPAAKSVGNAVAVPATTAAPAAVAPAAPAATKQHP